MCQEHSTNRANPKIAPPQIPRQSLNAPAFPIAPQTSGFLNALNPDRDAAVTSTSSVGRLPSSRRGQNPHFCVSCARLMRLPPDGSDATAASPIPPRTGTWDATAGHRSPQGVTVGRDHPRLPVGAPEPTATTMSWGRACASAVSDGVAFGPQCRNATPTPSPSERAQPLPRQTRPPRMGTPSLLIAVGYRVLVAAVTPEKLEPLAVVGLAG